MKVVCTEDNGVKNFLNVRVKRIYLKSFHVRKTYFSLAPMELIQRLYLFQKCSCLVDRFFIRIDTIGNWFKCCSTYRKRLILHNPRPPLPYYRPVIALLTKNLKEGLWSWDHADLLVSIVHQRLRMSNVYYSGFLVLRTQWPAVHYAFSSMENCD